MENNAEYEEKKNHEGREGNRGTVDVPAYGAWCKAR